MHRHSFPNASCIPLPPEGAALDTTVQDPEIFEVRAGTLKATTGSLRSAVWSRFVRSAVSLTGPIHCLQLALLVLCQMRISWCEKNPQLSILCPFWASRIVQIMFNWAIELALNTFKQAHKSESESWVLLLTKCKMGCLMFPKLLFYWAVLKWWRLFLNWVLTSIFSSSTYGHVKTSGHPALCNSLSARAEAGRLLFSCITVNLGKLHCLKHN